MGIIRKPSEEDNNIEANSNMINDTRAGNNQFINKKRRGTQTTTYSLRNYEKKELEITSYKYNLRNTNSKQRITNTNHKHNYEEKHSNNKKLRKRGENEDKKTKINKPVKNIDENEGVSNNQSRENNFDYNYLDKF